MKASAFLKKGNVIKRISVQGRQLIEVTVFGTASSAELQYSMRKSQLNNKGWVKYVLRKVAGLTEKITVADPRQVEILGRKLPLGE